MTVYLIKMALCSALMLTAYYVILEKAKMYRFNRFYLLFSLLFSLLVPFITREVHVTAAELPIITYEPVGAVSQDIAKISTFNTAQRYDLIGISVLIVYLSVAGYFLYRFARNIHFIRVKIAENDIIPFRGAYLVLLEEDIVSHTFLNHIFINSTQFHKQLIEEELLTHELSHVKQRHSIDILIIEFLQCVLWMNPVFILYKKAIEMNHEFLADEAVLSRFQDVKNYQRLLLNKVTSSSNMQLTHSFNYSITKKRLTMMTRSVNTKNIFLRQLLIIPLLVAGVMLFSNRLEVQAQQQPMPIKSLKPAVKIEAEKRSDKLQSGVQEVVLKDQPKPVEILELSHVDSKISEVSFERYPDPGPPDPAPFLFRVNGTAREIKSTDNQVIMESVVDQPIVPKGYTIKKFLITGDVQRPGTYTLVKGLRMSVGEIISYAGGLKSDPKYMEIYTDDRITREVILGAARPEAKAAISTLNNADGDDDSRVTNGVVVYEDRVLLLIDKNTTKQQLEYYKAELFKAGVILDVPIVEWDKNNKLSYIALNITCEGYKASAAQNIGGSHYIKFYKHHANGKWQYGFIP